MSPCTFLSLRSIGSSGLKPKTTETTATALSGHVCLEAEGGLCIGEDGAGASPTQPPSFEVLQGSCPDSQLTVVQEATLTRSSLSKEGHSPSTISLRCLTKPSPQDTLQCPTSFHTVSSHSLGHSGRFSHGTIRSMFEGQPGSGFDIVRCCFCCPLPQVVSQTPTDDHSEMRHFSEQAGS